MPLRNNLLYVKENFMLIAATLILSLAGYFFHLVTGKKLGPEDYGLVVSLLAIVYLVGIFLNSMQSTITTKISELIANNQKSMIAPSLKFFLYKNLVWGFIASVGFILLIPIMASSLNTIDYFAFLALVPLIFASFLLPVARGFFQGTQQFGKLSMSYVLEGFSKVLAILILFYFGRTVSNAVICLGLSYFIPFLIALVSLPKLNMTAKKIPYRFINPITLLLAILTLFYSADLLLVKHFFSAYDAGLYSAMSLYGKVILFSAIPIAMILLPKGTEANVAHKKSSLLIKRAIILISALGLPLIISYFTFPEFIIHLTLGSKYIAASPLLGYYAIGIFLISISYILTFYAISLKQEKKIWLAMLLIWALEPMIIIFTSNKTLSTAITALVVSSALLILFLSFYTTRLIKHTQII